MKRLFGLLLFLFFSLSCMAQLEVKEDSFKEVTGFININTEKMYDENDKPYAVLKIKTVNISSKQRHELFFNGDGRTFTEVEYHDGEVWVYISYYATYIKIYHEELSSTEFHFPFDMEPKKGYELTLVNKTVGTQPTVYGMPEIKTNPSGATVYIDDVKYGVTTLTLLNKIFPGEHNLRLEKSGYKTINKKIVIDSENITYIYETLESTAPKATTSSSSNNTQSKTKTKSPRSRRHWDWELPKIHWPHYYGYDIGFVTFNVTMNNFNQMMYGLTVGGNYEDFYGFMFGFHTNTLHEIKTDYVCGSDFIYNDLYPAYTGKMKCENTSFLLGLLLRDNRAVAFRLGVGFATQNVYYEVSEENYSDVIYIRNNELSFVGVELSAGIQCYLGGFFISVDGVTTQFKNYAIRVGIGIAQ